MKHETMKDSLVNLRKKVKCSNITLSITVIERTGDKLVSKYILNTRDDYENFK